jgi:hypothetical protein
MKTILAYLRRAWRRLRLLFTGDRKGPGGTLHD